jgi:hypothetical protein
MSGAGYVVLQKFSATPTWVIVPLWLGPGCEQSRSPPQCASTIGNSYVSSPRLNTYG